jgi:predicted exporter
MVTTRSIRHSLFVTLFALVSVFAGVLLVQQLHRGLVLETDLQALFPRDEDSHLINRASDRLTEEFGNQLLLAVSADEREQALHAANILQQAIVDSGFMQVQQDEQLESLAEQQALLQEHRFHLLADTQRDWLQQNNQQALVRRAQQALFGFSAGAVLSPAQDPMALFGDYVQRLQPYVPGEIVDDRLLIATDKKILVIVSASLQGDALNLAIHDQLSHWLTTLNETFAADAKTADVNLLMSGAVFHAAEASASAQSEVTIISFGSTLGILLLFLLSFRRIKPLLFSFASVMYGSAVALAINHWLFNELHLMTLVFGASLIGVAIDYALHYLCKHQQLSLSPHNLAREAVLQRLLPALSLGLLTSLLGYSCLLQAELPGLRQIASFSLVGLASAWLFVVAVFPLVFRATLPQPASVVQQMANWPWRALPALNKTQRWIVGTILLVGLAVLLSQLRLGSDLRLLYQPSPDLLQSEKILQQSLQGFAPNQYFLVRAATPEAVLQKEEQFRREQLAPLLAKNALRGYAATSLIVPSREQQQTFYQLQESLYGEQGLATDFMARAGFDAEAVQRLQQAFRSAKGQWLDVPAWLAVARPDQRLLWLGEVDGAYASVIALRGVADVQALAAAAQQVEGVIWVDRVADMSRILKHLQRSAMLLLALAYLAVVGLMWLSFRRAQATLLVLVPLAATAITLALLTACGVAINLFHVFGCYLILGLGMDYSIFAYQSGASDESCRRAILLSALTSGLSFGLLALSSTPMVSAFGITLLLGSLCNLLLAPLLSRLRPGSEVES